MEKENKQLEEKKAWLKCLSKYVKPGKIVEFGCGSGFVLEALSEDFTDSVILGIDKSIERLEKVVEKDLKNVIPIKADITQNIFPNGTFDTALFVASLHEVYSYLGKEKVQDVFRMAHSVLKNDGILIIQDFLKPSPKLVEITFGNGETRKKFFRFAHEFRPREVRFKETQRGLLLDIADAVEFISKYRSPNEEDWNQEMVETHFFFTEKNYAEVAQQTDFIMKNSRKLRKSSKWWDVRREDIEFDSEIEYSWIQLVLIKK